MCAYEYGVLFLSLYRHTYFLWLFFSYHCGALLVIFINSNLHVFALFVKGRETTSYHNPRLTSLTSCQSVFFLDIFQPEATWWWKGFSFLLPLRNNFWLLCNINEQASAWRNHCIKIDYQTLITLYFHANYVWKRRGMFLAHEKKTWLGCSIRNPCSKLSEIFAVVPFPWSVNNAIFFHFNPSPRIPKPFLSNWHFLFTASVNITL